MAEPSFVAAPRVGAVQDANERQVRETGIAQLELTAAEGQRGLLGEISGELNQAQPAKRSDGLGALAHPGQGQPAEHAGLVRVLAARVADHQRIRPGHHLSPVVQGLELPPVALGFPSRLGEPVGVVHPVVVDAPTEENDACE